MFYFNIKVNATLLQKVILFHNFDSFNLFMLNYNLQRLIKFTVINMSCGVYSSHPGLHAEGVHLSLTDPTL